MLQTEINTRDILLRADLAVCRLAHMTFYWPAIIGFLFGFGFGVGCALAVMYSIYLGGYRAAIKDSRLSDPPERYRKTLEKLAGAAAKTGNK
jgi:hypothetical protein